MSHEIFLKIFNGWQNIFLCSLLVKGVWAKNVQTGYPRALRKVKHVE